MTECCVFRPGTIPYNFPHLLFHRRIPLYQKGLQNPSPQPLARRCEAGSPFSVSQGCRLRYGSRDHNISKSGVIRWRGLRDTTAHSPVAVSWNTNRVSIEGSGWTERVTFVPVGIGQSNS